MLRVGTRGSKLALAQTGHVISSLRELDPDLTIEPVVVESADSTIMDKSRYVSSIEEQLRSQEVDLAVHSAKDVPGEDVPGLLIVAVPERVDPLDTLLGAESLADLREGATVGTSSLRRAAQLLAARPDLKIEPLRGNIDTRLGRLADGDYDAIVLAAAGLDRLGVGGDIVQGPLDFIPAPGQGCLALQVRDIDLTTTGIVGPLSHGPSQRELIAERAASSGLVASCNTPLGVNAVVEPEAAANGKDKITVRGWLGLPDGTAFVEDEVSGLASEAHLLGHLLAQRLRGAGGDEILARAEEMAA
ncbi:MAG: hydroxymethylbilane synthase [Thermoleophilaceae bacterium]|nr:hydroxymethylbilane synthase [Thermoleophilaceae bacterium]